VTEKLPIPREVVLVTGATGNVGAPVIDHLLARGASVRAAVRPRPAVDARFPIWVTPVDLDLDEPSTFEAALADIDRVFLMRPPQFSRGDRMRPFIAALRDTGVRQVAFLSVQGAGSNPMVPHNRIEQDLKNSGVPWTILRPSFFMSNLSTTHREDIVERDEVFVPAGQGRTNFIDVGDIAEAAAVVLTEPGHEGKAYELTGSEALTYEEVAGMLSDACGRPIVYPSPSSREFKQHMREAGHDEEFISVMGSIYTLARLGMASGTTGELEKLIGRPPTTLAEWARANAECFAKE
jgi:uncharacterized protein YbjT (DUF2867 family)